MKLLLLLGLLGLPAQADFGAPLMKKWPPVHGSEQDPLCHNFPWDQEEPDPAQCDGTWTQMWDKQGCKRWFCTPVKPSLPERYCGPGQPPAAADGCHWVLYADSCYYLRCANQ